MFSSGSELSGIGGWLVLVALGLAVSPFMIAHSVYADLHILSGDRYQAGLAANPGLAGMVLFEAVTNSMFVVAVLALNYLLYQQKRAFPTAMVVYFAAQVVWVFVDHLMAMRYTARSEWSPLLRALITAIIWIPYFRLSQRVQATFTND
jgi:hypothetical protein